MTAPGYAQQKSGRTLDIEPDDARQDNTVFNQDFSDRNWKLESARSGATRIDEENAVTLLDPMLMRMPRDHDLNPRRRRVEIEQREVVNHTDMDSTERQQLRLRDRLRPSTLVVVPANRRNRRDGRQSRQHFRGADIAAVKDPIATSQEFLRFRPQE